MNNKESTEITHITYAEDNIFTDLGFPPEEADALLAKSDDDIAEAIAMKKQLMLSISHWIKSEGYRQSEAASLLHVSRPRVSDVVNQKTEKFTLDSLIGMVYLMGKRVKLVIE